VNGRTLQREQQKNSFFAKVEDRLNIRIKTTPKLTAITTGHGNIKSYLYKCKIIDNPQCQCKNGDQTMQHIIFECTIFDQHRDKLKAVVMKTEDWPVRFNKLSTIYYKNFKEYIDSIIWDNDYRTIYVKQDIKCIKYRKNK